MKTMRFCLNKPGMTLTVGDDVSVAISCDLEKPLKGSLYYNLNVVVGNGPKRALSGEICNQKEGNQYQYCNTTKLEWKSPPRLLFIPSSWRPYAGRVRGTARLSDEDGLFLCLNASGVLQA
jgi:hypothetical protein